MKACTRRPVWLLSLAVAAWSPALPAATVNDFNDILSWTGSGTNASALVVQFGTEETPTSIAWGYRWDDPVEAAPIPTVAAMVFALTGQISGAGAPQPVAGADPRLAITADFYPAWNAYFINAFSYDQIGLPNPWSQSVRSMVNDFDNDLGIAFYTSVADPLNPTGPWPQAGLLSLAAEGMTGTPLAQGGWYGFVIQEYDETFSYPPSVNFTSPVSAVPEPGTWALLAGGAVTLLAAAGSGLPAPSRRTFTSGILAFAHSMLSSLHHPGFARPATPARRYGQPLADRQFRNRMWGSVMRKRV
jgi:hypothetical protein